MLAFIPGAAPVTALSGLFPMPMAPGQTMGSAVPAVSDPDTRRSDAVKERFGWSPSAALPFRG